MLNDLIQTHTRYLLATLFFLTALAAPLVPNSAAQTAEMDDYFKSSETVPITLPSCNSSDPAVAIITKVSDLGVLENTSKRIFCVAPGSYGQVFLDDSGTSTQPRYLVAYDVAGQKAETRKPWDLNENQRALFSQMAINSPYWVISRIAVRGLDETIVGINGGSHDIVLDNMLIEHTIVPNPDPATHMLIATRSADNVIQNSVLRSGLTIPNFQTTCINLLGGSNYNKILNNEINCTGDGLHYATTGEVGVDIFKYGTLVEGNEIYITSDLYADCDTGVRDVNGTCACAENGIDIKVTSTSMAPMAEQDVTKIRKNVMYGFRKAATACAGSGSLGPAMVIHHPTSHHIVVENNLIFDAAIGLRLLPNNGNPSNIVVRNNIFSDVHAGYTESREFLQLEGAEDVDIYQNLFVGNEGSTNYINVDQSSQKVKDTSVFNNIFTYAGKISESGETNTSFLMEHNAFHNSIPYTSHGDLSDEILFRDDYTLNQEALCLTTQRHSNPHTTCVEGAFISEGSLVDKGILPVNRNYDSGTNLDFFAQDRTAPFDLGIEEFLGAGAPAENNPPTSAGKSVTLNEDVATAILLSGNDPDGDALTYTIVDQPANGVLTTGGSVAEFIYTPGEHYYGTDAFSFSVHDGVLTTVVYTVNLTVNAVNDAPISEDEANDVNEDKTLSIRVKATDTEDDPITYNIASQPANGTVVKSAEDQFDYTPNPHFNGTDSFQFDASDGQDTGAPATVTVTVNPVNDKPVADAKTVAVPEDTPTAITLTGSDIDGDPLTYIITRNPNKGSLSGNPPNLTYTPNKDFTGTDSFKFKVNDGTAESAVAVISLNINTGADAPVADDIDTSVNEDKVKSLTLTGSDIDGDALTFTVATQPANGTVAGTPPDVTYTPDADFNGVDTFTFTASDGTFVSEPGTVTVTVNPLNDAPAATAQTVSVSEDTPKAFTLAGTDVDGDNLSFILTTSPKDGTLSGTAPNLTYTPNANFTGEDSFKFKVSDGTVESAAATITLLVGGSQDAPVADDIETSVTEDKVKPITLTGVDNDGDPLTFTVQTQPANGTVSGTPPDVTYTPDANFNGVDTFTFTAYDGTTVSAPGTVTITVDPANDAPTAEAQTLMTPMNQNLPVVLISDDADGDALTYIMIQLPRKGLLFGTAPNFTYKPNNGYTGTDKIRFKAFDGVLESSTALITIQVGGNGHASVVTDSLAEASVQTVAQQAMAVQAVSVAADEAPVALPEAFALAQNYPNPFNPSTLIAYDLPEARHVRVTVYNTLGQLVASLVNDYQDAGRHQVRFDASNLSDGLYLYVMETSDFRAVKHMVLLK